MRRLGTSPMRLRAILRRHGIPCRISQDGGRYLCNAAYYQALDAPVPVLFIHIPKRAPAARPWRSSGPLRRLSWPEALAAALVDVGVLLTVNREHKRRAVAARGRPD
jgi:pyroglutamyl-peptidase